MFNLNIGIMLQFIKNPESYELYYFFFKINFMINFLIINPKEFSRANKNVPKDNISFFLFLLNIINTFDFID